MIQRLHHYNFHMLLITSLTNGNTLLKALSAKCTSCHQPSSRIKVRIFSLPCLASKSYLGQKEKKNNNLHLEASWYTLAWIQMSGMVAVKETYFSINKSPSLNVMHCASEGTGWHSISFKIILPCSYLWIFLLAAGLECEQNESVSYTSIWNDWSSICFLRGKIHILYLYQYFVIPYDRFEEMS